MNTDRFKFRVWDKYCKEYLPEGVLLDGRTGIVAGTKYDGYVIEQCTGLTDKNGKLIYEGDVDSIGMAVRYRDGAFEIYKDDFHIRLNSKNAVVIEITGNIHEMEVEG